MSNLTKKEDDFDITNEEVSEVASEAFLPDNYNVPSGEGNYMKLEEGENKFRVLQSPILGYELWISKKPKRYKMTESIPIEDAENADVDERTGEPRPPKHFWAMCVFNYKMGKVQILELTQKGVQKTIKELAKSKDWGTPLNYDLNIVKEGKGFETTYEVVPVPPRPLPADAKALWEGVKDKIDIQELFTGGDPFKGVKEG